MAMWGVLAQQRNESVYNGLLEGEGQVIAIATCPVAAYEHWLARADIAEGRAFCAVDHHGRLGPRSLDARGRADRAAPRRRAVGLLRALAERRVRDVSGDERGRGADHHASDPAGPRITTSCPRNADDNAIPNSCSVTAAMCRKVHARRR
jgi:hypothetical protein